MSKICTVEGCTEPQLPFDHHEQLCEKHYVEDHKGCLMEMAIERKAVREAIGAHQFEETLEAVKRVVAEPRFGVRRRLPAERNSKTHRFQVNGHKGYITVGLYEDGTVGEIFVKMAKEGSTLSGLVDGTFIASSMAIQHGAPLSTLAEKFIGTKFDPSGVTTTEDIEVASSVLDYVFRWVQLRFPSKQP